MTNSDRPYQNASIRSPFRRQLIIEPTGPLSIEKLTERIQQCRNDISKSANRFAVLSIGFVGCFLVKIAGLRLDLVFFDQEIFELPYGSFVFCAVSQALFILAISRNMDSRIYDRYLRAICDKQWGDHSASSYLSFPNSNAMIEVSARAFNSVTGKDWPRRFAKTAFALLWIVLMIAYLSPIIIGVWFLISGQSANEPGVSSVQIGVVLFGTGLSILWLIACFSLFAIDTDVIQGEEINDTDKIRG